MSFSSKLRTWTPFHILVIWFWIYRQ